MWCVCVWETWSSPWRGGEFAHSPWPGRRGAARLDSLATASDLESHERTAKILLVWQELNMRHVSQEKKEGLLRVNRLMAQQLREIQRKEAEQLRETQHIKASPISSSLSSTQSSSS